jgi:hypothetical protein
MEAICFAAAAATAPSSGDGKQAAQDERDQECNGEIFIKQYALANRIYIPSYLYFF